MARRGGAAAPLRLADAPTDPGPKVFFLNLRSLNWFCMREAIKRKRVTRVGSGAFSIYLPKKWIDSWLPEQQEHREVDLHQIGESLLIIPVLRDRSLRRELPDDHDLVLATLLSAYIQGHVQVRLTPSGTQKFNTSVITDARDLLRHLDERLLATCTAQSIGYDLQPDLPPPAATGHDLLNVMGAKVREVLMLATEAVEAYGTDPDRTLHALKLLRATHEEDVNRLFCQAIRLVANIELPLESVTDFQFLDLLASNLQRISDDAAHVGQVILRDYGLESRDLDYPRDHLLEKLGTVEPPTPLVRAFVRANQRALEDCQLLAANLLQSLLNTDIAAAQQHLRGVGEAHERHQERLFSTILEHWGDATDPAKAQRGFTAYQVSTPVAALFNNLEVMGRHGISLIAASDAPLGR